MCLLWLHVQMLVQMSGHCGHQKQHIFSLANVYVFYVIITNISRGDRYLISEFIILFDCCVNVFFLNC